jgi:OTT_1508-like deaminase
MFSFTDLENDELLSFAKYLDGRGALPVKPLETLVKHAPAHMVRKSYPLERAAEAILLHDMFASFLSTRNPGSVIAVAGGFGTDGQYHVVGAGNAGRDGVHYRPSDALCNALAQACTGFISGNTESPTPHDMSGVLVASLDICHTKVKSRLEAVNTDEYFIARYTSTLDKSSSGPHVKYCSVVVALKGHLGRWEKLESQEKSEVAICYGQLLGAASELWDKIKATSTQFKHDMHTKLICKFNKIAKGLYVLHKFPRSTCITFDWPQGPQGSDPFMPLAKMDCRLHCEIYLALHILFSDSDVTFDSFLITEGKKVFIIGCSKASCIACWDILLKLTRQDPSDDLTLMCRTRCSHGKCYGTWGPPRKEKLPLSLQAILNQAQMSNSLNVALRYSHQEFEQRVRYVRSGGRISPGHSDTATLGDEDSGDA